MPLGVPVSRTFPAQGHAVAELGDEPLEPEGHLLGRRVLQQLALTSHWIRSRYG
jgi:hypothetical protein